MNQTLENYLDKLQITSESVITDALFCEMICQVESTINLSDQELASLLLVSVPSIKRWKEGINLPATSWRPIVFSYLRKQVKDLLIK